jgi:GNAT superfamily N-acetyltransferase
MRRAMAGPKSSPAGRAKASGEVICAPLTPERWADLKTVFGPSGGFWGCWCQFWMTPRKDFDAAVKSKQAEQNFRREVGAGPPPGLIAYRNGAPVGWVRIGPRRAMPQWNGARRVSAPLSASEVEDSAVWAIACFVVPRAERGQGVASALLRDAVEWARANGAQAIDACPVEADGEKNPASIYHGVASMFERAGFAEIARRKDRRPLMRLHLATARKKRTPSRKSR